MVLRKIVQQTLTLDGVNNHFGMMLSVRSYNSCTSTRKADAAAMMLRTEKSQLVDGKCLTWPQIIEGL